MAKYRREQKGEMCNPYMKAPGIKSGHRHKLGFPGMLCSSRCRFGPMTVCMYCRHRDLYNLRKDYRRRDIQHTMGWKSYYGRIRAHKGRRRPHCWVRHTRGTAAVDYHSPFVAILTEIFIVVKDYSCQNPVVCIDRLSSSFAGVNTTAAFPERLLFAVLYFHVRGNSGSAQKCLSRI